MNIFYELGKINYQEMKNKIYYLKSFNPRVLVEITDINVSIRAISDKAYIKDLVSKKYFYYVFMHDMNFDAQFEDFNKKLDEWIKLRGEENE